MDKFDLMKKCTGCGACVVACPKNSINMDKNVEGFLQPKINQTICVQCGVCEKVCPILNPLPTNELFANRAFVAYVKSDRIRFSSSSGGIFSVMAAEWIEKQGIVYGAAFSPDRKTVEQKRVTDVSDLAQLRGSKYIQCDTGESYRLVKYDLLAGCFVMYVGTPCMIAGLVCYLGNIDTKNLLTVEVACHGVPSPGAWRAYLSEMEKLYRSKTKEVYCRYKRYGWKPYCMRIEFENGGKYTQMARDDAFLGSFNENLTLRPSCYSCRQKGDAHCGDMIIADCWGIGEIVPGMNDNKGASAILVSSKKGGLFIDTLLETGVCEWAEVAPQRIIENNKALIQSAKNNGNRDLFMNEIASGKSFQEAYSSYSKEKDSILKKCERYVKAFLRRPKWKV